MLNSQSSKRKLTNDSFNMEMIMSNNEKQEAVEEHRLNLNVPQRAIKTSSIV